MIGLKRVKLPVCLFGWLVSLRPRQQQGYIAEGSQDWRLTILRAATHETKQEDHDFCLSRSYEVAAMGRKENNE